MGAAFSPVGFLTGGLAGPASVVSHPSLNNFLGGGAFTSAVPKKNPVASIDPATAPTVQNKPELTAPEGEVPKKTLLRQ